MKWLSVGLVLFAALTAAPAQAAEPLEEVAAGIGDLLGWAIIGQCGNPPRFLGKERWSACRDELVQRATRLMGSIGTLVRSEAKRAAEVANAEFRAAAMEAAVSAAVVARTLDAIRQREQLEEQTNALLDIGTTLRRLALCQQDKTFCP